jgi:hypothetical protein
MNTDQADYELCESFHIDNGELDGFRRKDCFVLGVEWQMVAVQADTGRSFTRPVHEANVDRLSQFLNKRGLIFNFEPLCEGWSTLSVEAM